MRITTGKWKGKKLTAPSGLDVRPTSDKARQALFNILLHGKPAALFPLPAPQNLRVLDVFCGTGALGLEALSRGAARVGFMDLDVAQARANAASMNALEHCEFYAGDAAAAQAARQPFDLIFMDPPYGKGLAQKAFPALRDKGWIAPKFLLIVETAREEDFSLPGLTIIEQRQYGAAQLWFLTAAE